VVEEQEMDELVAKKDTTRGSSFEIAGTPVRLMSVDDLQPRDVGAARQGRSRKVYVKGEIAHFEFDGHRYALVAEESRLNGASLRGAEPALDGVAQLTNRELQICQLICMGYLTKQVAARLNLSQFTVRSYLKAVYCKLSVRSRGAMVYRFTQVFGQTSDPELPD
jgi:DNA-binding CsgD family transcriptional regulator